MKKAALTVLLLLLIIPAGYAQSPCGLDFKVRITKSQLLSGRYNWRAIANDMTDCEAMALLSDTLYQSLVIQLEYQKALNKKLDSLVQVQDDGQSLRDSLNAVQKSFIAYQQGVINKYDTLLVQSNQLIKDANANTDRALRRLTLLRWTSIGGIAIGVGGLLVALAAN